MTNSDDYPLVSTDWLAKHLHDPDIRIVDVRWGAKVERGKGTGLDDRDAFAEGHIPGAVFLAIGNDLSDPDHAVPDMLVGAERFAEVMGNLGIGNDTAVIAYDNSGLPIGAARLWWALSYYGHENVKVLNGGLKQWLAEGRQLSTGVLSVEKAKFVPVRQTSWIAEKSAVVAAMNNPSALIIDCLPKDQYEGDGGSDLWGTRAGHIPGAVNMPAICNLDPHLADVSLEERARLIDKMTDFTLKPPHDLQKIYELVGLTPEAEVITYCGRGYAASCGLLALKAMGHSNARMYDGSWAEWSADPDLPSEKGKAS